MTRELRKIKNIYAGNKDQLYYAVILAAIAFFNSSLTILVLGIVFLTPDIPVCEEEGRLFCSFMALESTFAISNNLFSTLASIVSIGLLNISIFFLLGLAITHKTFGPLIPFGKHLDALLHGDFSSRVALRKDDHMQVMADKLNELAVFLESDKNH